MSDKNYYEMEPDNAPLKTGEQLGEEAANKMATATANVINHKISELEAASFARGVAEGKKEGYTQALDDLIATLSEYKRSGNFEEAIETAQLLKSENGGNDGKVE